MKGKVSFIEESVYEADFKFGELQTGSLEKKYTYSYNENGNKTEKNWYEPDGSLAGKLTYKYDENENKIEEK